MATDIPEDSSGSLGALSISDDDCDDLHDDEALQSDTWIEELECALLADCDPATLKKICEGKRIPASLRPDYWRTLLALNDAGKVKLTSEYDLPNQNELRRDCEQLVDDISASLAPESLSEPDKLRLKSDFESTLTTYVKARPELDYVSGNGWIDILRVLHNLELNDTQLYQMFFRIVDRYIPKDLSPSLGRYNESSGASIRDKSNESNNNKGQQHVTSSQKSSPSSGKQQTAISATTTTTTTTSKSAPIRQQPSSDNTSRNVNREKSIQAYHLLRLLIQYHDPELCSILDSKKVLPNLYAKDWFCSLFARSCPTKLALHMWDMHFKMADPFLIFFAGIVMVVNASDELKKSNLSQASMLEALKRMPSLLEEDDVEDLYYLVSNHYTNSTPRSIRSYSHLFFMDTFGATYMGGSESPELDGSSSLVDLKTCRLTTSLDLSQYLCLPIVPAEIFALDTAAQRSSPSAANGQHSDQGSRASPSSSHEDAGSPQQSSSSERGPRSAAGGPAGLQTLRYFLVDCRPAEQYNAGHLARAFHLDCSLMLREPSSFATAVQALLEIQRQIVASKSNTGGQHLCFIGSGQDEEDRYVNMVVASFLQKYQKYVSIVVGGFDAIHDYVKSKQELRESFGKFIVDHNEELCKACCAQSPEAFERFKANAAAAAAARSQQAANNSNSNSFSLSSAQSLFASTTGFFKTEKGGGGGGGAAGASALSKFTASNPQATATAQQLAQSGVSMFDKFTTAFVSKSSVFKDRLVETLNNTALPTATTATSSLVGQTARSHVSSQDRLGPRYTGGSFRYDELAGAGGPSTALGGGPSERLGPKKPGELAAGLEDGPCQEVQIDQWRRENDIMALYTCAQIRGTLKYPGYIGLNKTHLWILREIPHNKGFASIAAKRPLDMVVQVTSKRRQPDLIIFRYGYASSSKSPPSAQAQGQSAQERQVVQSQPEASTRAGPVEQPPLLNKSLPTIIASDHLHIPQAFEVIRLIKREVVRIMDETARKNADAVQAAKEEPPLDAAKLGAAGSSSEKTDEKVGGSGDETAKAAEQVAEKEEDEEAQETSLAAHVGEPESQEVGCERATGEKRPAAATKQLEEDDKQ